MSTTQINVPDIGADSAEVIEVLVSVGEEISEEQSIIVLESDKASLEVPAPCAGVITSISVSVGDELSEGDLIAEVETAGQADAQTSAEAPEQTAAPEEQPDEAPVESSNPVETASTTSVIAYTVPDIGSDESEVIELSVSVGDSISEGDTICVAESDKASLEIPAEADGKVVSLAIAVGDTIGQGNALIELEVTQSAPTEAVKTEAPVETSNVEAVPEAAPVVSSEPVEKTFSVPDLGSDSAEVIELSVAAGDQIEEGDTICVAESDKASLEVPAEATGKVLSLGIAVGDNISKGDTLISLEVIEKTATEPATNTIEATAAVSVPQQASSPQPKVEAQAQVTAPAGAGGNVYAGPAVRKLARELGVDLSKVPATGVRGRIVKEDLHNYVKKAIKGESAASGSGIPAAPKVDWAKFGSVRTEAMTKIHKVTADNMSRCWLNVPHVTQFDNADVTDYEDYRQKLKAEGESKGIKMTPVAFLVKLAANTLREVPKFNSSIHEDGKTIVFREYCHIGLAVDTPAGLMVPVIRDADTKDIWEIASDIIELATKAKEGKLKPNEMQGSCFTISSLGALGGTGFTPIVPSPQVGILGVSKTAIQPVWDGESFVPRKLMPLALSYDHRAVNGGDAGRFLTYLVEQFGSLDNLW